MVSRCGFAPLAPMNLTPDEAYTLFQQRRQQMSPEEFFNDPSAATLRDLWVAAHFGRAYAQAFTPCRLIVDESHKHEWDFKLGVNGVLNPFQVTEAQTSGRRRGLEYRRLASGDRPALVSESWEPGTMNGPEWIRQAIERKRNKNYANASDLNLLVYANFPAHQLEFARVQEECRSDAETFYSVWVITGNLLGAVSSQNSDLAVVPRGWLMIDQSPK